MWQYLYIVGQMQNGLLHAPAGNGVNCIIKCYALQTNLPLHSTIISILNQTFVERRNIMVAGMMPAAGSQLS